MTQTPAARYGVSLTIFRTLLALYPKDFRARFAAQMCEDFHDLLRSNTSRGPWRGRLTSWQRTVADLIRSIPRERFQGWPQRRAHPPSRNKRRGDGWMRTIVYDLRYAVRGLLKSPGFSIVVVLTLALGIGANTAIFTLVNQVLLRPLPYDTPEGIVALWQHNTRAGEPRNTIAPATLLAWEERNAVFASLAAYYADRTTHAVDGEVPEWISIGMVMPRFFQVLRATPLLGRDFHPEERRRGNHRVAILSFDFWNQRFGGDESILGKIITLNRLNYEVVGVMPPYVDFPRDVALWRPIVVDEEDFSNWGAHYFRAIARLAPGVTVDHARADMERIAANLAVEHPMSNAGWGVTLSPLHADMVQHVRPALLLLQGAVFVVLLIACVNVANLQLARGHARQGEIAVRTALGAGRGRIARLLLTESVLLSLIGGAVGLVVSRAGIGAILTFAPPDLLPAGSIPLDLTILAFTLLVAGTTGVISGLTPALQSSQTDLSLALRETGTRTTGPGRRLREGLVVLEISLSLVLLIGGGLLINSFIRLVNVDPGVNPEQTLTMRVSIPASKYSEPIQRASFFQQLQTAVGELPGVQSVGLASALPVTGIPGYWRNTFYRPESPPATPDDRVAAQLRWVGPGYFETMGIPFLRGRDVATSDVEGSPNVLVIDATMAHQFFPSEDPIGKRLLVEYNDWEGEIVGIVGNARQASLNEPLQPHMYLPFMQTYSTMFLSSMVVAIRAEGDPRTLIGPARRVILSLDGQLAPSEIATFDERLTKSVAAERFNFLLVGSFAAIALALAAIGLYGVIAYLVSQRTRELGVRMALGARHRDVMTLVLRHGLTLTAVGLGIGIAAALLLGRVMSQFLYDVRATDPLTIVAVSTLLAAVGVVAVIIPARRAARVDPIIALRYY